MSSDLHPSIVALVSLAEVLGLPPEERALERGNFLTVLVLSGSGQSVVRH